MPRPRRRGADKFVLPALIVGLAICYPGHGAAGATRTAVEGQALDPQFVGLASDFYDKAGGEHFRHLVITWIDFSLYGEGIDIKGTATADCSGNVDKNGTGPFSGTFVVRTADHTLIFEGRFNGYLVEWMAAVAVTAHGSGAFEGKLLMLDMEENNPADPYADEFDMSGSVINLGR